MPALGRPTRRAALVAAASQVELNGPVPFRPEPDSDQLWAYYHALGEVWYVSNFKAQAARRLTYFVGHQPEPSQDPEEVTTGPQVEALERVQGPMGSFGDFVAELCPHLTVVGEGFFVSNSQDEFDVWSSDEMRKVKEGKPIQRHQDEIGSEPVINVRIWRPDPQWRHKADSPLRSVQTEADTIILLRDMIQALTRSRLVAKILGIPEEISFWQPGTEDDPESDPFMDSLIEAIVTSVTDSKSAARFAPLLIRGPGASLEQIQEIDLTRDMPEWIDTLIDQSINRLANGLDFPSAMLVGIEDLNHWSAWVIEESTYKQHVDPLVQLILDSLTRGYLWPYLQEAGVSNWQEFRFWRDYSDLTARTASVETTLAAQAEGLISDEAARKYLGFNEADAPDEPEPEEVEVELPAGRDNTVPGPPLVAAATPASSLGDIDRRLFERITEASQAALDRALERAGNKIVSEIKGGGTRGGSRAPRHPKFAAMIEGRQTHELGLVLGRQAIHETLQLSDNELVPADTFDSLGSRVEQLLEQGQAQTHTEAQRLLGRELPRDETAERAWRERAREFLTGALSALALSKLFTPDPRPDPAETGEVGDSHIPAGDVFDTLTLAGGGEPSVDPTQPRGLATGQQTTEWVQEAGAQVAGYVWQHGAPAIPFEPHLALNGTRFDRWTSETLATPAHASWLRTPYMFPGDHRGCSCLAVPIVETPEGE